MKPLFILALWSIAAVASAQTTESNCFRVWDQLRCPVQLEPKPPVGGPPRDVAGEQPCLDAKGKPTTCPASAPKRCEDANGRSAKCGTPGAKPV